MGADMRINAAFIIPMIKNSSPKGHQVSRSGRREAEDAICLIPLEAIRYASAYWQ